MENEKMDQQKSTPINEKPTGSYDDKGGYYKKGGWKKWLVIYIIVAIVLYGLIYIWYRHDHPTTTSSGTTSNSLY